MAESIRQTSKSIILQRLCPCFTHPRMGARHRIKSVLLRYAEGLVGRRLKPARDIFERSVLQETVAKQIDQIAIERGYDDVDRYEMVYAVARRLLPEFSMNDHSRTFLRDRTFRDWFVKVDGGNFRIYERRWMVKEALRLAADVDGDLAECGVFEGAASFQLCQFARAHGRRVHLFDSFEGLSKPGERDGNFWWTGALSSSEHKLRENLKEFDCFETYKGWIPERFSEVADRSFAFIHIDVDLEQPTRDSIAFFYPRLSSGGVILLDDHGYDTCPGARKAVLDYMADKREPVIDLPTGQGLIIKK